MKGAGCKNAHQPKAEYLQIIKQYHWAIWQLDGLRGWVNLAAYRWEFYSCCHSGGGTMASDI
jgi:hypothetical protein